MWIVAVYISNSASDVYRRAPVAGIVCGVSHLILAKIRLVYAWFYFSDKMARASNKLKVKSFLHLIFSKCRFCTQLPEKPSYIVLWSVFNSLLTLSNDLPHPRPPSPTPKTGCITMWWIWDLGVTVLLCCLTGLHSVTGTSWFCLLLLLSLHMTSTCQCLSLCTHLVRSLISR